tara:strand:+ start:41 stop:1042 length:1002 start_codon:yes stop_codon:yes gene_type:complete
MTTSPGDDDLEVEKASIAGEAPLPQDPNDSSTESQNGLSENGDDRGQESLPNDGDEGETGSQENGGSELPVMPEAQQSSNNLGQVTEKEAEYSSSGSSVVQFLALYLIVLAFFIWLVSLARFDGVKSLAVIQGLKATFETREMEKDVFELQTLIRSKVTSSKQFEDSISGLFSTLLGVEKVEAPTPGRTMRVVMNADTLFESEKTKIKQFNFAFMDRVIASLSERPPGYHFDMEFIIGSDEDASGYGTLPVNQTLQMARAGVFVRSMLARGAPPDTLSVGIRKGNPNTVTLWFYIRSPVEVNAYYEELKKTAKVAPNGDTLEETIKEGAASGG